MAKDASDFSNTLLEQLNSEKRTMEVSFKFMSLENNAAKIRYSLELFYEMNLLPPASELFEPKSDAASLAARNDGNKFFKDKEYVSALKCYNRSISLATINSEHLPIGYANRSAVYLNSGFYKFCMENIELAQVNNYPDKLKSKLEQRKKDCLELISKHEDSLEKFKKEKISPELSYEASKKVPIMIEGLEYARSEQFGRYIKTRRDLYPGDVIIIEKPYIKLVGKDAEYDRCANCLDSNYSNLIPCLQCTRAMFCSEDCRQDAWKRFHKYECPIIDGIFSLFNKSMVMGIRTAIYSFTMFKDPEELEKLIRDIDVKKENAFALDYANLTEQQHFRAIYAFATNESDRKFRDLLKYTNNCAIAWHFLSNYTDLRLMLKTKDLEDFFLNTLLHFVQVASVNTHALGFSNVGPTVFGGGLFALCSLVNHSCAPNVVRIADGITNVVVVRRVIKAGEQLFDSYGPPFCLADIKQRQAKLKIHYNFDCQCQACIHDYPLLRKLATTREVQQQFISDQKRIKSYDKEYAKKKFNEYKKYLKKNHEKYPSFEVCVSEDNLITCFCVLTIDTPLEYILKPIEVT